MKVFELYFNPKGRSDRVFDSFVYDDLYMVGELTRALPQSNNFLDNLAGAIKDEFYSKADISEALRGANNFLELESKSGNVNWLGNFNFAVVSIKDSILNFTKVGDIKILLIRDGEVLDISQNLELQDQEPYSLKVFSNVASGKLLNHDKIIILTQEVFSAISKNEALLKQLGQVSKEKDLKNIFKLNKEIVSEISGICLFIAEGNQGVSAPVFSNIKLSAPVSAKRIALILILSFILISSYFIFKGDKSGVIVNNQENLEQARSKIIMAENFLILKKDEKAQALFQEAWDILQPIKTKESLSIQESIKKYIISTPQ